MGAAEEDINRRLLRARDLIDRRYAEPLDIPLLARAAVMAPSHFIREFKRVFGETPHRYLQRRRIERAMFLLRTGDEPVTDVCLAVGFTSLGSFSRAFREIVGLGPTAYRAHASPVPLPAPTGFTMRWSRPVNFGEAPTVRRP
ncbi:MAG: AraC family transcriptional regulator [Nocardioidaceae bacterium]